MKASSHKDHKDKGSILVVVALALPVLIGMVGMAIDVGDMMLTRRQEQSAADAAAMAGAREVFQQNGSTAAKTAAQDSATRNGFANGVNNVTVTVNTPPLSGPNAGNAYAVEVIISSTQHTYFMSVVGSPTSTVAARAVGTIGASSTCIETTGPVGEGIDIDGGFILNAPTCGLVIDSINTGSNGATDPGEQSVTTHGGDCKGGGGTSTANYTNPTGTSQVVVPSFSTAAPYYDQGACVSNIFPGPIIKPTFNAPQQPDLLGYLAQPSNSQITACDQYNAGNVSGNPPLTISGTATLYPGSYCGGIWLKSGAND